MTLGQALEIDLWVQDSPAIALLSMSQLRPTPAWASAVALDSSKFDAAAGHIEHEFRPASKGLYMLDWQFYLSGPKYRVSVRLSVDSIEQYVRDRTDSDIPNCNPRGTVAISVV